MMATATKTSLKKSIRTTLMLIQLVQLIKCWQTFLELNSKRQYQSSGIEKESCLVFTSSTKHEIWHFHVIDRQQQQRNVQKSVMHVHVHVHVHCFPVLAAIIVAQIP